MTHRFSSVRLSMLPVTLLLIGVTVLTARPADGQVTTKLAATQRLDPGSTIGAGFLTVSHDGVRPVDVVLHAYRIEGGRTVSTHESRPMAVAPERLVRLGDRQLPPERFYGGKVMADIEIARAPVPIEAVDSWASSLWSDAAGERWAQEWSAVQTVEEWKRRDAVLFVVLPADRRLRTSAMTYPVVISLTRPSR